jgi:hypothetical protein
MTIIINGFHQRTKREVYEFIPCMRCNQNVAGGGTNCTISWPSIIIAFTPSYDTDEPHYGLANFHEILTIALFEESWLIRRSKSRDRRSCARRNKSQTHQVTISTFGEVFLRNHASSSELLAGQKHKNAASFLFPHAQPPVFRS